MPIGHCHCGAISYEVTGTPVYKALCHCEDCRRHAGAPAVGWAAFPADGLTVHSGTAKVYASSEHGRRHFCPDCGTGLFYYNEHVLPGLVDIQIATLDDPAAMAPDANIQVADRIGWMATAHELPVFDRYPAPE
jgi:hypothetical protein